MPRPFGRDHEDVHVRRWHDFLEVNVKAVRAGEVLARFETHADVGLVHLACHLIGSEDHDDVSLGCGLGHLFHREASVLGLGPGRTALLETDPDIHPAVAQVERMGVALTAIPDDGGLLVLQQREIRIFVIIDIHAAFSLWVFPLSSTVSPLPEEAARTCVPRCMATLPVRTISLIPSGFSKLSIALIFSSAPVTST